MSEKLTKEVLFKAYQQLKDSYPLGENPNDHIRVGTLAWAWLEAKLPKAEPTGLALYGFKVFVLDEVPWDELWICNKQGQPIAKMRIGPETKL